MQIIGRIFRQKEIMAQLFEVTWSDGIVTPELISSLLYQYVTQGGLYGTVVVKEAFAQWLDKEIFLKETVFISEGFALHLCWKMDELPTSKQ